VTTLWPDWTILDLPGVTERARALAADLANDSRGLPPHLSREDVAQDALLHLAMNASAARAQLAKGGLRFLYVWLRSDLRNALDAPRTRAWATSSLDALTEGAPEEETWQQGAAPRVRATAPSARPGSDGYTTELVEHLLPAVVYTSTAYGMTALNAPGPGMPRGQSDPARSCTLFAHLADVRIAWGRAVLALDCRRAVVLHLAGWSTAEIAAELGCSTRTVNRHLERAVERMAAWLNGGRSEQAPGLEAAA
jgi:AraC-like DNA-binding protein